MNATAHCFGLYDGDTIVGFCGVIHQAHPVNKKLKRCSRIVILPDYQGIGLGVRFLNVIADYYAQQSFDFSICTSAKNMIYALKKSDNWILTRYSAVNKSKGKEKTAKTMSLEKSYRESCKTASFMFKRQKKS